MKVRFKWFHANVMSNPKMSAAKVAYDLLKIKKLGLNGGFNEIAPDYYKDALNKVFGHAYNLEVESPQVINPKIFNHIKSYVVKTHGGWKLLSPPRSISITLCETRRGHFPVAFLESHYVNKGGHKSKLLRRTKLRNKLHDKHFKIELDVVTGLVGDGFTVFGAEDTNRIKMPKYSPRQVWVHQDGIDKMWYVPAFNHRVRVVNANVITDTHTFLNTDHAALQATIEISAY